MSTTARFCTTMSKFYSTGFPPKNPSNPSSEPEEQSRRDGEGPVDIVFSRKLLWDAGKAINIQFLQPATNDQIAAFQRCAQDWLTRSNANLTVAYPNHAPYDIIVSFNPNDPDGNWSRIGTNAQFYAILGDVTLNIASAGAGVSPAQRDGYIYHELGHAFGAEHEQQSSEAQNYIKWNLQDIVNDVSRPPNNWTQAQVEQNITNVLPLDDTVTPVPFDKYSVMMYTVPVQWTTNGFSAGPNNTLSNQDLIGLAKMYPK